MIRSITSSLERHASALENTLSWADEAAARGDYRTALEWLRVLDIIGDALPEEYEARRAAWRSVCGGP